METIYLRRMRTKDGILGPIEQIAQPVQRENRAVHERMRYSHSLEASVFPDNPPPMFRSYTARKTVHCVLIEMEED